MNELDRIKQAPALAVIGVSLNKEKYPYKIWRFLKSQGKTAYPVNPSVTEVDGEQCYASISDLPSDVSAAIAVVSPRVTETLPEMCKAKGIDMLWMQPGAGSEAAKQACLLAGITPVVERCVMAEW